MSLNPSEFRSEMSSCVGVTGWIRNSYDVVLLVIDVVFWVALVEVGADVVVGSCWVLVAWGSIVMMFACCCWMMACHCGMRLSLFVVVVLFSVLNICISLRKMTFWLIMEQCLVVFHYLLIQLCQSMCWFVLALSRALIWCWGHFHLVSGVVMGAVQWWAH